MVILDKMNNHKIDEVVTEDTPHHIIFKYGFSFKKTCLSWGYKTSQVLVSLVQLGQTFLRSKISMSYTENWLS